MLIRAMLVVGVLVGCTPVQSVAPYRPIAVICDDPVPEQTCENLEDDGWGDLTNIPRDRILGIQVLCVVCDASSGEAIIWATLRDGTMVVLGRTAWQP